jgi:hypothetical protein
VRENLELPPSRADLKRSREGAKKAAMVVQGFDSAYWILLGIPAIFIGPAWINRLATEEWARLCQDANLVTKGP